MKLVYVASPVRGDVEENLKKANRYCEYVAGCGHIPVAPHLAWQDFLPENPENHEKALDTTGFLWYTNNQIFGSVAM